jgi:hypothetical protein
MVLSGSAQGRCLQAWQMESCRGTEAVVVDSAQREANQRHAWGDGKGPSGAKRKPPCLVSPVSSSKAARQRLGCCLVKLQTAKRAEKAGAHQQMLASNARAYSRQSEAALWPVLLGRALAGACDLHGACAAVCLEADRTDGSVDRVCMPRSVSEECGVSRCKSNVGIGSFRFRSVNVSHTGLQNRAAADGRPRLWEWAAGGVWCSAEAVTRSVAALMLEPKAAGDASRSIDVSMIDLKAVYALDSQGRLCET